MYIMDENWELGERSIVSSSCILEGSAVTVSSFIMTFKILEERSLILEWIMHFERGTASHFFLGSKPQNSLIISNTQGITFQLCVASFTWQCNSLDALWQGFCVQEISSVDKIPAFLNQLFMSP